MEMKRGMPKARALHVSVVMSIVRMKCKFAWFHVKIWDTPGIDFQLLMSWIEELQDELIDGFCGSYAVIKKLEFWENIFRI